MAYNQYVIVVPRETIGTFDRIICFYWNSIVSV